MRAAGGRGPAIAAIVVEVGTVVVVDVVVVVVVDVVVVVVAIGIAPRRTMPATHDAMSVDPCGVRCRPSSPTSPGLIAAFQSPTAALGWRATSSRMIALVCA